jgi:hypothetical protein
MSVGKFIEELVHGFRYSVYVNDSQIYASGPGLSSEF